MAEQKQYGDVVVLVRGGVAVKALVMQSVLATVTVKGEPTEFQKANGLYVPDASKVEEHLTLAYLDPELGKGVMGSTEMDAATKRAIGVAPLAEGGVNGWKPLDSAAADAETVPKSELEAVKAELAGAREVLQAYEDLDAAAPEVAPKEATAGAEKPAPEPEGAKTGAEGAVNAE